MEQIWEGVLWDGLEGNVWEEGLPLCVQSRFECLHGCSGHNILWQLVPVWDYSDAERMLATTSLTPLLVNLQSITQCEWGQQRPRYVESRGDVCRLLEEEGYLISEGSPQFIQGTIFREFPSAL